MHLIRETESNVCIILISRLYNSEQYSSLDRISRDQFQLRLYAIYIVHVLLPKIILNFIDD